MLNYKFEELQTPVILEKLTDAEIYELSESPKYAGFLSPLERELLIRLSASMETSQVLLEQADRDFAGVVAENEELRAQIKA